HLLVYFGNAVGNTAYYLADGVKHHPNLYALLVGNTSRGRKGTAAARVRELMNDVDSAWSADRTVSGLSSGEGVIEVVRDEVKIFDADKGDFKVVDPGISDKRLLVTEAEFASALAVMERAGNRLSPVARDAWDGIKLQTLT